MQKLPIGIQAFEDIRIENYLYVDKTKQILNLIENGKCYFLSRPRRFGKSLTISTLEAMFKGKADLFKGLYAEEWVKEQAKHPNPVITLDMSGLGRYKDSDELNNSILNYFERFLFLNDFNNIPMKNNAGDMLADIIIRLYKQFGQVVVLIDEYDKPITDNIDDFKKANEIREFLRPFYTILKTYSKYLRFVFITGISKFTKVGIFSGLNNLDDIKQKVLDKIKEYYDGFSFDGITRVYNPFSVLKFFGEGKFRNYWYDSCTPSFLAKYFKEHKIQDSDEYRHLKVSSNFTNASEIEQASPESFLFQTGYLTIEKWDDDKDEITLDFPNKEVKDSLPNLYLYNIYNITDYIKLADKILVSLKNGDMLNVMLIFNGILAIYNVTRCCKSRIFS